MINLLFALAVEMIAAKPVKKRVREIKKNKLASDDALDSSVLFSKIYNFHSMTGKLLFSIHS